MPELTEKPPGFCHTEAENQAGACQAFPAWQTHWFLRAENEQRWSGLQRREDASRDRISTAQGFKAWGFES